MRSIHSQQADYDRQIFHSIELIICSPLSARQVIVSKDLQQQEKSIKYNDLVANAVIFLNVIDKNWNLLLLVTSFDPPKYQDVLT